MNKTDKAWIDLLKPADLECDSKEDCNGRLYDEAGQILDTSILAKDPKLDNEDDRCIRLKKDGKLEDKACFDDNTVICQRICVDRECRHSIVVDTDE